MHRRYIGNSLRVIANIFCFMTKSHYKLASFTKEYKTLFRAIFYNKFGDKLRLISHKDSRLGITQVKTEKSSRKRLKLLQLSSPLLNQIYTSRSCIIISKKEFGKGSFPLT